MPDCDRDTRLRLAGEIDGVTVDLALPNLVQFHDAIPPGNGNLFTTFINDDGNGGVVSLHWFEPLGADGTSPASANITELPGLPGWTSNCDDGSMPSEISATTYAVNATSGDVELHFLARDLWDRVACDGTESPRSGRSVAAATSCRLRRQLKTRDRRDARPPGQRAHRCALRSLSCGASRAAGPLRLRLDLLLRLPNLGGTSRNLLFQLGSDGLCSLLGADLRHLCPRW